MKAKNHIIFNIFFIFLLKNYNIFYFSNIEWNFLFLSSIITCLLPDIDHPNSFIGRKIKFISKFLNKNFGHREITHSLLSIIFIYIFSKYFFKKYLFIFYYKSIYYGITIGYFTHIFADMLTKYGVSFLWPIKYKFKIKLINIFLILLIIFLIKLINKKLF